MKLIFCPNCQDIVKPILDKERRCSCGKSYGKYKDNIIAFYGGSAIPLGFDNFSLYDAIQDQPEDGEGKRFASFVIPKEYKTFKKK